MFFGTGGRRGSNNEWNEQKQTSTLCAFAVSRFNVFNGCSILFVTSAVGSSAHTPPPFRQTLPRPSRPPISPARVRVGSAEAPSTYDGGFRVRMWHVLRDFVFSLSARATFFSGHTFSWTAGGICMPPKVFRISPSAYFPKKITRSATVPFLYHFQQTTTNTQRSGQRGGWREGGMVRAPRDAK